MKVGTENRQKTMWAGALMVAAVIAVGTFLYNQLGGSDTPRPAPPPPRPGLRGRSTRITLRFQTRRMRRVRVPRAMMPRRRGQCRPVMPQGRRRRRWCRRRGTSIRRWIRPRCCGPSTWCTRGRGGIFFRWCLRRPTPVIPKPIASARQKRAGRTDPPRSPPTSADLPAVLSADQPEVLRHGDLGEWHAARVFVAGRGCFYGGARRNRGAEVQDRVDCQQQHPGGRFDQQQYPDAAVAV